MVTCAPSADEIRGHCLQSGGHVVLPADAEDYQSLKERFENVIPAKFCHDPQFDLPLVARLVELMGVKAELSLVAAMSVRFGASKAEIQAAVKLVVEALRLLHLCKYPKADIEVIMAHASAYLQALLDKTRVAEQPEMGLMEVAHVFVLVIYLAHSYVEDETCPMSIWHKRLFLKYCDLATLNQALMRLMEKLAFALRISETELAQRLAFLKDDLDATKDTIPRLPPALSVSPVSPR